MQTTLLNHILTSQHGKRIAVIENEVLNSTLPIFVPTSVKFYDGLVKFN